MKQGSTRMKRYVLRFVVYKDTKGEWRWHLKATNGRILADSGEGYKRRQTAVRALYRIFGLIRSGGYNMVIPPEHNLSL